jgi:hypothetical protein
MAFCLGITNTMMVAHTIAIIAALVTVNVAGESVCDIHTTATVTRIVPNAPIYDCTSLPSSTEKIGMFPYTYLSTPSPPFLLFFFLIIE